MLAVENIKYSHKVITIPTLYYENVIKFIYKRTYSITGMNVRFGELACKKHNILFEEETQ